MTDMKDGKPVFEPTIVLDDLELAGIQIKKPKRNKEQLVLEKAKAQLIFSLDLDKVERYTRILAGVLGQSRGVQLGLRFVEQLEHRMAAAAEKNGSGKTTTGLEPIPISAVRETDGGRTPAKKKRERETAKT